MKSKGFSLTEIIAVIVILAIIIAIATPIYFRITNNANKNLYNTKIEYLRSQAIKYAEEQYIEEAKTITTSVLIYDGYIAADEYREMDGEEVPFIANPMDSNSNLACRLINIGIEDYGYKVDVTKDENCDYVIKNTKSKKIGIKAYKYSNGVAGEEIKINDGIANWVNTNVIVYVNPTYSNIDNFMITHNGASKNAKTNICSYPTVSSDCSNIVKISTNKVLKDKIDVSVNTGRSSNTLSLEVRIDKEAPEVSSAVHTGWTLEDGVHVVAYASDGSGIGAKYVYLTRTKNASKINDLNKYTVDSGGAVKIKHGYLSEGEKYVPLESGIYYLWGEDKLGNRTSSPTEFVISAVDTTPPTCEVKNSSTKWTKKDRTINYICVDPESGCKVEYSGYSQTIDYSAKQVELNKMTAIDNSGNKTECGKVTVNAYVDKDKPTVEEITVSSYNSLYKTSSALVKVKAKDSHSGIKSVCILVGSKNRNNCTWVDVDKFDSEKNQGPKSYTFSIDTYVGAYDREKPESYQIYAFVKDGAENVSETTDKSSLAYRPYKYCDKTVNNGYGEWGHCNKDCGGGKRYRDAYYKDEYFDKQTCPTVKNGDSEDCNTHDCPSGGSSCCTNGANETDGGGDGPHHWGCTCDDGWHGGGSGPGATDC